MDNGLANIPRYWRYRAPRDLFPKPRDLPEDDHSVDWDYLCLGAEKPPYRVSQLWNCRNAYAELWGPTDLFRKLLGERERMV